MGEGCEYIDFRQRQSRLTNPLRLARNCGAQLGEQPPLDFDDLFLRIENLAPRIPSTPEW